MGGLKSKMERGKKDQLTQREQYKSSNLNERKTKQEKVQRNEQSFRDL